MSLICRFATSSPNVQGYKLAVTFQPKKVNGS